MKYEVWYETDTGEHYEDTYGTKEEAEEAIMGIKDDFGEDTPCNILEYDK